MPQLIQSEFMHKFETILEELHKMSIRINDLEEQVLDKDMRIMQLEDSLTNLVHEFYDLTEDDN